MKRQLSVGLIINLFFNCCVVLYAESATTLDVKAPIQSAVAVSNLSESVQSSQTAIEKSSHTVKIVRQFTCVPPEQVSLELSAEVQGKASLNDELNQKILGAYLPVHFRIVNKSQKMLKIPFETMYFSDSKGNQWLLPTNAEVFRRVKRHGIRRALAWSVPIGVASFGILLIPAAVISGVHTVVTNNSLKEDLQHATYRGGHLAPSGSVDAYVLLPKNNRSVSTLVLGRVINEEDDVETEKVIEIKNLEIDQHVTQK